MTMTYRGWRRRPWRWSKGPGARWEDEPKYPAHERPAPPARRRPWREQVAAQASTAEGEAASAQQQTLRLF